ncbi:hypothetical protein CDD83_3318 [Cordyceps sp. RAO-2017]|nr:hypothetical protein CDD83_3318 [Cordyceps sp. RAO-2017]
MRLFLFFAALPLAAAIPPKPTRTEGQVIPTGQGGPDGEVAPQDQQRPSNVEPEDQKGPDGNISITLTGREGELPKSITVDGETVEMEQADGADDVTRRWSYVNPNYRGRPNRNDWGWNPEQSYRGRGNQWHNNNRRPANDYGNAGNQWHNNNRRPANDYGNAGNQWYNNNNRRPANDYGNAGNQRGQAREPGEILTFYNSPHIFYEDFKKMTLDLHNKARNKHQNTDSLVWNEELAEDARRYSARCVYEHGHSDVGSGKRWGQNIAYSSWLSGSHNRQIPDEEKTPFYNAEEYLKRSFVHWWDWERFLYNWWNTREASSSLPVNDARGQEIMSWLQRKYPGKQIPPQVGHFTQIVWRETTEVGCAVTVCQPVRGPGVSPNHIGTFTVCNYAPSGNIYMDPPPQNSHRYTLYDTNVAWPQNWTTWWSELDNRVEEGEV